MMASAKDEKTLTAVGPEKAVGSKTEPARDLATNLLLAGVRDTCRPAPFGATKFLAVAGTREIWLVDGPTGQTR